MTRPSGTRVRAGFSSLDRGRRNRLALAPAHRRPQLLRLHLRQQLEVDQRDQQRGAVSRTASLGSRLERSPGGRHALVEAAHHRGTKKAEPVALSSTSPTNRTGPKPSSCRSAGLQPPAPRTRQWAPYGAAGMRINDRLYEIPALCAKKRMETFSAVTASSDRRRVHLTLYPSPSIKRILNTNG